jgi:hypothetical protein
MEQWFPVNANCFAPILLESSVIAHAQMAAEADAPIIILPATV